MCCVHVCVCACVFAWVHVYACPCVVRGPLSLSVMEGTEKERGYEKAETDCGVEDPQCTALIGYLPKDF